MLTRKYFPYIQLHILLHTWHIQELTIDMDIIIIYFAQVYIIGISDYFCRYRLESKQTIQNKIKFAKAAMAIFSLFHHKPDLKAKPTIPSLSF